jgi:hypothetical protein
MQHAAIESETSRQSEQVTWPQKKQRVLKRTHSGSLPICKWSYKFHLPLEVVQPANTAAKAADSKAALNFHQLSHPCTADTTLE